MKCVSLFSGAGGLDLGLHAAGIDVLMSLEADSDCCETLRQNGFSAVKHSTIEDIPAAQMRKELGLKPGELDLIVGGPPCQPFSKSAYWAAAAAKGLLDPRASTLAYFCAYIEEFKPKAFILENVEGFEKAGGLNYVKARLGRLRVRRRGYSFNWRTLDASSFGVPQRRKRCFLVATLGVRPFQFPEPTFGDEPLEPLLTAWEAMATNSVEYDEDLRLRGRWADLVQSIPEGENYLWHTPRGGGEPLFGWRTRYWSFLLKLAKNRPSPTLVASPSQNSGPFHWNNRLLSTAELAALQTFPPFYGFSGGRTSRQRQIGNAVPPLLAQSLGVAISAHLNAQVRPRLHLGLSRSASIPAAERTSPVSAKYLSLRGDHSAHPGTGRGPNPRPADSSQPEGIGLALRGGERDVA